MLGPKCPICKEKLFKGYVDLGKAEGVGKVTAQIWICPHMRISERKGTNIYYYCKTPAEQPQRERTGMSNCPKCGKEMIRGWVKLSDIKQFKDAGMLIVKLWICPNTRCSNANKFNMFYYCNIEVG